MKEEHKKQILYYDTTIKAMEFYGIEDINKLKALLVEIKKFGYENDIPGISEEQNRQTYTMLDGIKKNTSKESLAKKFEDTKKELLTDLMHARPHIDT
ncbi:hypothetical protein ACS5PU_02300 [Pedobacter sp. GSP4]|uniref:hypothetical protein n=1 Tax=Pedobacter sp. GSP4 TaxID=3453716 RepID=UPI003EF064BB